DCGTAESYMKKAPRQIVGRPIRVAIVGCGRISANHFKALELHKDNLQLVAVCDTDHAALEAAQSKYRVTGFTSLPELLAKSDVDLVTLCTPSGLHPSQAIMAAQAGRHVMTEKPMATRGSDGLRMVRACDDAGVHLLVIKQNRRNATLQLVKHAMEKGRFGRIYMATINVFWAPPRPYTAHATG